MKRSFELHKNECALLVVDMQRYFCDKKSDAYVPNTNNLTKRVKNLIEVFEENNRPIIYTRHIDSNDKGNMMQKWWQDNIKEDNPMSEIIEELDAVKGDIIVKHQYDAFLNTDLEKILRKKKVRQVVICGVLTNLCCESTARAAFMRGFEVYFATDATATYKKKMYEATLLNLSYGFAILVTVNDVLKAVI